MKNCVTFRIDYHLENKIHLESSKHYLFKRCSKMMVGSNSSERMQVIDDLKDAGCCHYCILRLLGEKNYLHYVTLNSVLQRISELGGNPDYSQTNTRNTDNADGSYNPTKKLHTAPCISCLGLLEENCDQKTIDKIEEHIRERQYKFKTFVIQLSTPVTVDLRDRMLQCYLKQKFSVMYEKVAVQELPSVKEVWKWAVGSKLGKLFNANFKPNGSFAISVDVQYDQIEEECKPLQVLCPDAFPVHKKKRKRSRQRNKMKKRQCLNVEDAEEKPENIYTKAAVFKALGQISPEVLATKFILPPAPPATACYMEQISCTQPPLYLAGRYNKYSRNLSQTPWYVDGGKRMETSVQELIVDVVKEKISAEKIVFSASGREDVDTRMLGKGRPFVLEFTNPRLSEVPASLIQDLQMEINRRTKDITVNDFQIATKEGILKLKEGEEKKKKCYSAKCCINRSITKEDVNKISSQGEFTIIQRTPIRVLHRRPVVDRERTIYEMKCEILSDHIFRLHLKTQAGTYVKEFVHGDFGRTKPHLGQILGAETDIIELDVESIDLDWPPYITT